MQPVSYILIRRYGVGCLWQKRSTSPAQMLLSLSSSSSSRQQQQGKECVAKQLANNNNNIGLLTLKKSAKATGLLISSGC